MAKKKVFLHIGPQLPGAENLHEAFLDAEVLVEAGLVVPPVTAAVSRQAGPEIRRQHKAEGLRRSDVEGSWAEICRRAFKAKSDVVISQDGFADAEYNQVALALDGLAGLEVHLVVTVGEASAELALAGQEFDHLIGHWAKFVKPHRIHVLDLEPGADAMAVAQGIASIARHDRQCGCQASSSAVRVVTAFGSLRSAS